VHHFDLEAAIFRVEAQDLARFPELFLIFLNECVSMSNGIHIIADFQPLFGCFVVILAVKLVQRFVFLKTFGLLRLQFQYLLLILHNGCFEFLVRDGYFDFHDG